MNWWLNSAHFLINTLLMWNHSEAPPAWWDVKIIYPNSQRLAAKILRPAVPFSEEEGGHLLSHFRLFLQSNRIVSLAGLAAKRSFCSASAGGASTLDIQPSPDMTQEMPVFVHEIFLCCFEYFVTFGNSLKRETLLNPGPVTFEKVFSASTITISCN